MTTSRDPLVSVVLPVRNEAATIGRAIGPFLFGPGHRDLEVIVADGGSTDTTREVVASIAAHDPRVHLVDNPGQTTPEGLNAGIRASRGSIIIRMDGHAEPAPDYLEACLAALQASGAWNVGGQMRKVGDSRAGRAASAAATSAFGIGGGRRFHLLENAADTDSVWLGCWPRTVFERIGLFDPELVGAEDEELNQRIIGAGGRIRFDPSIAATYTSRSSWGGLLCQYSRYGRAKVRAVQKRPALLRLRHLVPAAFVGVVVVGLVGGLFVPLLPVVAAGATVAWLAAAVWFGRQVVAAFDASLPGVVAAYACIHIGYGIGTWVGLVRFAPRWFVGRRGTVPALESISP